MERGGGVRGSSFVFVCSDGAAVNNDARKLSPKISPATEALCTLPAALFSFCRRLLTEARVLSAAVTDSVIHSFEYKSTRSG